MSRLAPGVLGVMVAIGCATSAPRFVGRASEVRLRDLGRGRDVPVHITWSKEVHKCSPSHQCPVVLVSNGYGVSHLAYSFIADSLAALDYTVVSVQHDLPGDAPLARQGDLFALRTPVWNRGAENLAFVRRTLAREHPELDFDHLTLVGHSNGGDLSLVFAQKYPGLVSAVVTLDHRRVPIPRALAPRTLSIRASDTQPDPGVVPSAEEQATYGIRIVQLSDARHNDMQDRGGQALKQQIVDEVVNFLGARSFAARASTGLPREPRSPASWSLGAARSCSCTHRDW